MSCALSSKAHSRHAITGFGWGAFGWCRNCQGLVWGKVAKMQRARESPNRQSLALWHAVEQAQAHLSAPPIPTDVPARRTRVIQG